MNHPPAPPDPPTPEDLIPALTEALRAFAEVKAIRPLSAAERAQVEELENKAEDTGAAGGLMEFRNEGIQRALASEIVYAVTTGPMTAEPPAPWTIMVDEDEQVIGEWLPASKVQPAKDSGRCIFLSEDFVMYKDRRPRGKSRFVMPFICLPLTDDEEAPSLCGVGCPSTPADEYIRSLMGNPGSEVATLVLGVTRR
jgi:hypothetical protein